jgi:molybdopterin-guanine dinucleotide biosynthesis protein A
MYGIIIAKGEKSRRLGEIKAFIKIDGIFLIEKIINEIYNCFEKVIIVTTDVKKFENIENVEIYEDKYRAGPLGGILTGLNISPYPYNFIFACDYPFIKREVVEYMKNIEKDYDILIPKKNSSIHPLFAIYSKNVCDTIEKSIKKRRYRVLDLLKEVKVKYVEDIENFENVFFNLNTKKDFERIKNGKIG